MSRAAAEGSRVGARKRKTRKKQKQKWCGAEKCGAERESESKTSVREREQCGVKQKVVLQESGHNGTDAHPLFWTSILFGIRWPIDSGA